MTVTINGTTGLATDSTSAIVEAVSLNHPSSSTAAITMDASNNVGINGSPTVPLQVNGSGVYLAGIESSTAYAFLGLKDSNSSGTIADPQVGVGVQTNDLLFRAGGAERARILSSGGITFNGDTAAANALSDYEEGDFSPTWQQGITSPTLGAAEGYYTKVGNLVTFCMLIYASSGTANSSHMYIGGLPYTSSSVITPSGVILSYQNGFKTNLDLTFHIPRSGTTVQIYTPSTGNPFYGTDATNVLKYLYLNGFYYTA